MGALVPATFPIPLVNSLVFNSKRNPHGSSVKNPYPFGPVAPVPEMLYLVYIGMDQQDKMIVRQAYDVIGIRGIDVAESDLFQEAKNGVFTSGTSQGSNFENMVFTWPCYFTIALDHPTWRFYYLPFEDHDPFVFITKKEKIVSGLPVTINYDPNYSFYDAELRNIHGTGTPCIRSVNYFRADITGRPLQPHEMQYYGFEIYIRIPFSIAGTGDQFATILIDPDGQNQGPPP